MASSRLGGAAHGLCPGRLAREGRSPLGAKARSHQASFSARGVGGVLCPDLLVLCEFSRTAGC